MKARAWLSVAAVWVIAVLLEIAGHGNPLRMAVIAVACAVLAVTAFSAVIARRARGRR